MAQGREMTFRNQIAELVEQGATDIEIVDIIRDRYGHERMKPSRVREAIAIVRGEPAKLDRTEVKVEFGGATRSTSSPMTAKVTLPRVAWLEREIVE